METKLCRKCGIEQVIDKFRYRTTRQVRADGSIAIYRFHRSYCRSCDNKYRTTHNNLSESTIKRRLQYRMSISGKAAKLCGNKKYKAKHKLSILIYNNALARKSRAECSYSYIKFLCTKRESRRGNTDYVFTEEDWLKESIILQTKRRLREIKKQLNLNK